MRLEKSKRVGWSMSGLHIPKSNLLPFLSFTELNIRFVCTRHTCPPTRDAKRPARLSRPLHYRPCDSAQDLDMGHVLIINGISQLSWTRPFIDSGFTGEIALTRNSNWQLHVGIWRVKSEARIRRSQRRCLHWIVMAIGDQSITVRLDETMP
jgi:hypothetical protein